MPQQQFTLMPDRTQQLSSIAAEDEPCVWCDIPVGYEVCFNGKDICIDCCVEAGNPCGH